MAKSKSITITPDNYLGLYCVLLTVSNACADPYLPKYPSPRTDKEAKKADEEVFGLTFQEICDVGAGEEEDETAEKAPHLVKFMEAYFKRNGGS